MIRKKIVAATAAGAVLVAGLTLAMSRSGDAQPAMTPLENLNAVATTAKRALGPRVRYLSAAWQNVIGISNRVEQLKSMGLKPSLAMIAGPARTASPVPAGRFGAVSAPPDFGAIGTRFSGFTTSETATAWCGRHAVVAFNDTGSLAERPSILGYSQSSDAGLSFTDYGAPPSLPQPVGGYSYLLGDPVAKCTSRHNFFISSLFETCTSVDSFTGLCTAGTNGVTVSPSTDGGKTFGQPVVAVSEDITQHIIDKDWMTVDPANPNDIYVTYTDFDYSGTHAGCTSLLDVFVSIDMVESTDGGSTWSPAPIPVVGFCNEEPTGSQVVVGSNGTAYVAWEMISGTGATREIDIASSTSGGPFSSPVKVSSVECSGDCFELQGMIRTNEFPSLTINPRGVLFMTWQTGDVQVPDALAPITSGFITGDYGFTDIEFSKSKDGGQTWSTPVRVNHNPASKLKDHFEPTIAVGHGRVAICFYDRRNDPRNFKIDRYCANSTNGGATWTNTRITGKNFASVVNQDFLIAPDYMGDYDAMAADALGRHSGFIDSFSTNAPGYPRVRANQF